MKKRLFIGVDISDEARTAAGNYINQLATNFQSVLAKWELAKKLHITLKFLGDVDEHKISGILSALQNVAPVFARFEYEVAGTGVFSSTRNPRVLWLGINESAGKLRNLAETVDRACGEFGFEPETRRFKPHLTIARIRDPQSARVLAQVHTENEFGPIQCVCEELVLFESHLGRGGSNYAKLATAKLRVK